MKSNEELVEYLKEKGYLNDPKVIEAFLHVDRKFFVPEKYKDLAYEDIVIPIKEGVTISQPCVLAVMIEALDVKPGMKVLEIGTGSGYSTAILSYLVGPAGKVISVEIDEEAYNYAKEKIEALGLKNVKLVLGDGSLGYPQEAPYDRIIIHASIHEIPPTLIWQLKEKGIIVAPIGTSWGQTLYRIVKHKEKLEKIPLLDVIFVPLKGKYGME